VQPNTHPEFSSIDLEDAEGDVSGPIPARTIERVRALRPPNAHARPLWSRLLTRPVQYLLDVIVLSFALVAAYLLRFELNFPADVTVVSVLQQIPFVVLVEMAALLVFGVYSFIWRYVGIAEISAFAKAAASSMVVFAALRLTLPSWLHAFRLPLSVAVMNVLTGVGGILVLRVGRRMLYERYERKRVRQHERVRKAVLFVGAGHAGVMAAREVMNRGDIDIDVKGFVDDDALKHDSIIHNIRVLGPTSALPELVKAHNIDHVVVTIARASSSSMRRILKVCEKIPVKVRVIPGLFELLDGRVEVNRMRDVQIEDLLGRDPVRLDEKEVAGFLREKAVLVTGAGGSIGSELCRQVARFRPSHLILVDRSENALFIIDRELRAAHPGLTIVPTVADICDVERIDAVLARFSPSVVFHAAAHKHVPMMEDNPGEAVKNNVLGTKALADACDRAGIGRFVMISTDKAVNPTSVMGCTKRVAELYVQSLSARSKTRFVAVRFGNVLGSNGSVVPIFREQIARGGPVTVTHPEMRRYFMTIPEASQLVLQAGTMGDGGEIFVLDMGDPVKILDLAKDVISLSGLKAGVDIQIEYTGLRPGEKLFEELSVADENATKTKHPKIFVGKIRDVDGEQILRQINALASHKNDMDRASVLAELRAIVPEFNNTTIPAASSVVLRAAAASL
jgi:FlaA1/EpsC-like NDP-sugar epimerase